MPGVEQQIPSGGSVRVANEVIASIAGMAAMEVEGVAGMDEGSARHFGDWLKRQTAHNGVRVAFESNHALHVELFLQVASDASVPQIAQRVQLNVAEAIDRMLGLEVAAVDVFVSSVAFAAAT